MHYQDLGTVTAHYNDDPISVAKGRTLTFITDQYISISKGLNRILYYPEKIEKPVMTATKPWEKNGKYQCVGGFSGKCIVVKDDKLMMFYSVYHMDGKKEYRSFAYAESKDGYFWSKPGFNKGTNLLIDNRGIYDKESKLLRPYYELQNVVYDEHSGQYLGLGHCKISKGRYGTFVATTKDPLKWDQKTFKLLYKNDDIHALMGWDEEKKGYLSYIRVPIYQQSIQKRAIGVSFSKDFKKWTDPILCHSPMKGTNQQIYNMPVCKYGGHYLGFPINYYPEKGHGGPLETGLLISTDGIDWKYQERVYIPRGLPGEWDDSYVMSAAPFTWKDTMWFYYWGANFPHDTGFKEEKENKGSVGLAVLPKNRMYSLGCNSFSPGTLNVTSFYLPKGGCKLVLNAHCPNGSISVYDGFNKLAIVPKNGMEHYLEKDGKRDWAGTERVSLNIYISDAEVFALSIE